MTHSDMFLLLEMIRPGRRLRCAGLLLLGSLLPLLAGCDSGCGDSLQSQSQPTTGGGAHPGPGGGDQSPVTFDANARSMPEKILHQAQTKAGAIFAEVDKTSYESKVVRAAGGVLVVSFTPRCPRWSEMTAALNGVSHDLAGQAAIYRLNVLDPEQAKVLPQGMSPSPVPGFAYYENGRALAWRQGLPFDRRAGKKGEPLEASSDYQRRLRHWIKNAVAAKNFDLPEPR